jgi:hypothetical protein
LPGQVNTHVLSVPSPDHSPHSTYSYSLQVPNGLSYSVESVASSSLMSRPEWHQRQPTVYYSKWLCLGRCSFLVRHQRKFPNKTSQLRIYGRLHDPAFACRRLSLVGTTNEFYLSIAPSYFASVGHRITFYKQALLQRDNPFASSDLS